MAKVATKFKETDIELIPPDKQEQDTKIVLEQAEILCKDWIGDS